MGRRAPRRALKEDGIIGQKTWTKLLTMWPSGDEPG
jgi:hypothetical protein